MSEPLDLLVIGSGVAGLSAAVRAAGIHGLRVGVLTKGRLHQATTRWAQGGVAAVLASDPDSTDLHLADTLAAGAGLCDERAVRILVDEGPRRVSELIALGAMFDRDADGNYLLAREGGHSMPRILHAGGAATGAEIERALVEAVQATAAALYEKAFATNLIVEGGACVGVVALDETGHEQVVRARNVLLAAGGAGQLFAVTTNPVAATGDGMAMAIRTGVPVADMEFVQFHPTALHHPKMPRPLLSEALRGHGAVLRDTNGERFVDELLPRDEVSRAMTTRMHEQGVENLYLDATDLEQFAHRFPTITSNLAAVGLDPATDWLPIAPAAHYCCGGVITDLDGATGLPGLWAAGEVATAGVHGANRLASNSLLDGMVFGTRVVEAVDSGKSSCEPTGAMQPLMEGAAPDGIGAIRVELRGPAEAEAVEGDVKALRALLQRALTENAGVLRSAESMSEASAVLAAVAASDPAGSVVARTELTNLVTVGSALLQAAGARTESRGSHTRTDFGDIDPQLRARIVLS